MRQPRYALALLAGLAATTALAQPVDIIHTVPGKFIDISKDPKANILPLGDDDQASFTSTIGNALLPVGQVVVSSNGGIGFNPPSQVLSPQNGPLPSLDAFGGGQALLALWDDIGNDVGQVAWKEEDNRLIIQWTDKPLNKGFITFQIQVFDASRVTNPFFQFIYFDVDRAGAFFTSTIGYQDGRKFDQYSLNGVLSDPRNDVPVVNGTVLTALPEPGILTGLLLVSLLIVRRR